MIKAGISGKIAVMVLATLLFGGCASEHKGEERVATITSEKAPVKSAADVEAGKVRAGAREAGQRVYESDEWGYRISYPEGWEPRVAFENPASPPGVIKQQVVFQRPQGVMFILDVWENPEKLGLIIWFNRYLKPSAYRDAAVSEAGVIQVAGWPSIKVTQPRTSQAYGEVIYVVEADDLIFRFRYLDSDDGESLSLFNRMLDSFKLK